MEIYILWSFNYFEEYIYILKAMSNFTFFGTEYIYTRFDCKQFEPRCEKTGLRGFRLGLTQTGLYNYRRWLEA